MKDRATAVPLPASTTSASATYIPGALTVSVVSHGQNRLLNQLLLDIDQHCRGHLTLILIENIVDPEPLLLPRRFPFTHLVNQQPLGYGANHNAAFRHCRSEFFCVLNPDLRLNDDVFPTLIETFADPHVGIVAPKVVNKLGDDEVTARRFPTPGSILRKAVLGEVQNYHLSGLLSVDWIAGMFMLFRSEAFLSVNGFDEGYFLYYEDVDICRRMRDIGMEVVVQPRGIVTHDAQRQSHRNPRFLRWHLCSMVRYFNSRRA